MPCSSLLASLICYGVSRLSFFFLPRACKQCRPRDRRSCLFLFFYLNRKLVNESKSNFTYINVENHSLLLLIIKLRALCLLPPPPANPPPSKNHLLLKSCTPPPSHPTSVYSKNAHRIASHRIAMAGVRVCVCLVYEEEGVARLLCAGSCRPSWPSTCLYSLA